VVARVLVILVFIGLLAAPFALRPDRPVPPADARRVIIITPHNEQIRTEFGRAFDDWHRRTYDEPALVVWNVPGGTSEIRKMLQAQYEASFAQGRDPGGAADLVFGGGSYEHGVLKKGVQVETDDGPRYEPISAAIDFDDAWLASIYGANEIGPTPLYDPDHHWFGTALSGFGIVFNRDMLREIDVPEPGTWEDLTDARLLGSLALVNPAQSGSITTAFESILRHRGWVGGWRILRRAGASARYFSGSSLKPPTDVSSGNAAMGVCIDFYGRFQSQAIKAAGGGDRVGYVDPPGASSIDPDPISMLRGAPNAEMAKRFVAFCLSDEAQALWQFRVDDPGDDGLGPEQFELRRMVIKRSMYGQHFDRLIDQVNPYEMVAEEIEPDRNMRAFVAVVFAAMVMDPHHELRDAWRAIVEHPAYPENTGIVTAGDVTDPVLREMLALFDAMPVVSGVGDGDTDTGAGVVELSLATTEHLGVVKAGWLRNGWKDRGLWPADANPHDVLRRDLVGQFRANYRRIVELAESAGGDAS